MPKKRQVRDYGIVPTDDEVKAMLYPGLVRNYAEASIPEEVWRQAEKKALATLRRLGARGARQAVARCLQSYTFGRKQVSAEEAVAQVFAERKHAKKVRDCKYVKAGDYDVAPSGTIYCGGGHAHVVPQ